MLNDLGRVTNGVRNAQSKAPIGGQVMASAAVMDKVIDGIGRKVLSKFPGMIGAASDVLMEKSKTKGTDAAIELLGDPDFIKNIKFLAGEHAKKAEQKIMQTKSFRNWMATLAEDEAKAINTVGFREYLLSE